MIVGKGFEEKRKELSSNQVEVVGTTSNIDAYYYKSSFVIAPIFNGSGMKTKTAEALMFGKTIFGTKEAFEGYDVDPGKVGALCNDADAFIHAVDHFIKHKEQANFNELSRSYFLENHDYKSALNKFRTYVLQHSIEQV